MPNRFLDASKYQFAAKDKLCLDTNVWFTLFPPTQGGAKDKWVPLYQSTFQNIKASSSILVADLLVLVEYANLYAQTCWKVFNLDPTAKQRFDTFKAFRKSPYFKPVGKESAHRVSKIISLCQMKTNLSTLSADFDISHLICDFENGVCDFNDAVICETCRLHQCKLLTNDADFAGTDYGIDIITHKGNKTKPPNTTPGQQIALP